MVMSKDTTRIHPALLIEINVEDMAEELACWNPNAVKRTIKETVPMVDPEAAEFWEFLATLDENSNYAEAVYRWNVWVVRRSS